MHNANALHRRRSVLTGLAGCAAWGWLGPSLAARPAPRLLLAAEGELPADPSPYLVSEKLDGVRALWDGARLWSRSGAAILAPDWFVQRLPAMPLDGELWIGRGRFEATAAALKRAKPRDSEWQEVRYMVFELPEAGGTFAQRAARIVQIAAETDWPALAAVPQSRVADRAALQRRLDEVVMAGGEGLMLHRADALYLTGRTEALLKIKPEQDAEAVVIGHLPGKGRHAGRLGALQVRNAAGAVFAIGAGFTDAEREAPPPLGTVITYIHRGHTRHGVPRFATWLRVRRDA